MTFQAYAKTFAHRVNQQLDRILPLEDAAPTRLMQAARYAVLNGGKRIRPLLVYAIGEALGVRINHLDGAAAALELIHCYSLIHDDLPSMDNDDLRRGQPTCHKAFDEATAILVGDALQTLAFEVLTDSEQNPLSPLQQSAMVYALARASGLHGMVAGQMLDILASTEATPGENQGVTLETLYTIHSYKTAALLSAGVQLALIAAHPVDPNTQANLAHYGRCIGLSYQIQDDILDRVGETTVLGKTAGSDERLNKTTFPKLLGLEAARAKAYALHEQAVEAASCLGDKALRLNQLSEFFISRLH